MLKQATVFGVLLMLLLNACSLRYFQAGDASYERGLALFDQGRYEEAIPYFQQATDESPDFGQAYLYLGRSYLNARRWREAIPPLRAAYRLSPAETKDEIYNFLLDALLAAASGVLPSDRSRTAEPFQPNL